MAAPPERSLRTRRGLSLPAVWLGGAALTLVLEGLAPVGQSAVSSYQLQDSYYVVPELQHALALVAVFALFAGVYWAMDRWLAYRRPLGWLHFWMTLAGSLIVDAPLTLLFVPPSPTRYVDPVRQLRVLSSVSNAGDVATLAGLLVFAVLLGDAVLARARPAASR
jgi:heme/copper-type cytochrome/quinol oxidase subunit 1